MSIPLSPFGVLAKFAWIFRGIKGHVSATVAVHRQTQNYCFEQEVAGFARRGSWYFTSDRGEKETRFLVQPWPQKWTKLSWLKLLLKGCGGKSADNRCLYKI